jgi:hypothetical protein
MPNPEQEVQSPVVAEEPQQEVLATEPASSETPAKTVEDVIRMKNVSIFQKKLLVLTLVV